MKQSYTGKLTNDKKFEIIQALKKLQNVCLKYKSAPDKTKKYINLKSIVLSVDKNIGIRDAKPPA